MKSVRLSFTKKGRIRFVSHLDMNRTLTRLVRKSGLDIWYTEGFNPHPYMTFALPLPLGFQSDYELMDIKINDDGFDIEKIPDMLNSVCPPDIRFISAFEPKQKVSNIAFASYDVYFDDGFEICEKLSEFLKSKSIITEKRTKKGDMKQIDLAPKIKKYSLEKANGNTLLKIILPAGPNDNINPSLLLDAFYGGNNDCYYCYNVTRTDILDISLKQFS